MREPGDAVRRSLLPRAQRVETVSAQSLIQGTDMQTVTMQVASFVLTECREGTCQHRAVRVRGWVGGWEW